MKEFLGAEMCLTLKDCLIIRQVWMPLCCLQCPHYFSVRTLQGLL